MKKENNHSLFIQVSASILSIRKISIVKIIAKYKDYSQKDKVKRNIYVRISIQLEKFIFLGLFLNILIKLIKAFRSRSPRIIYKIRYYVQKVFHKKAKS